MSPSTTNRFDEFSLQERQVFERFLTEYEELQNFHGIRDALTPYCPHPDGTDDFDILCKTPRGDIKFEIQISEDFQKWGDLRLDYVSTYRPASFKTRNVLELKDAIESGILVVEKWGKIQDPKADFLVVEFHNGVVHSRIYRLADLSTILPSIEEVGQFRTNNKRNEDWGSAFIAVSVSHPLLAQAIPQSLDQILAEGKS